MCCYILLCFTMFCYVLLCFFARNFGMRQPGEGGCRGWEGDNKLVKNLNTSVQSLHHSLLTKTSTFI